MRRFFLFIPALVAVLLAIMLESCEKDTTNIYNPYDDVIYDDTTGTQIPYDSNSITGIHKRILVTKCANPGCHDGSFEPDYRSVQSSYSTMVYHKIIKNNTAEDFEFRVVPGDTAMSVLYERITNCCFVNPDDRMPQDNIGQKLPESDIRAIAQWILDGAKDWNGQSPSKPSTKAQVLYFLAFNSTFTQDYSQNRIDGLFYNSFLVSTNTDVNFAVFCADDETPVSNLQFNRLEFSYDMNNFSSPFLTKNTSYINAMGNEVWTTLVNTGLFLTDTTVYMRYTVSDGQQASPSIMPKANQAEPYKTYWSFYITP